MKLAILRRSATVVASATAIVLISAGAALAFDSPGKPPGTGSQTINWTGQGQALAGAPNLSQCSATQEPNGQAANTPYLLWVLTTDGGTIATDNVAPDFTPFLTLSGAGAANGIYQPGDGSTGGEFKHFVTPFVDPNTAGLSSVVSMYITDTGSGGWNLVISHGCSPNQASAPTVAKNAAGAYNTTWTWGITKTVDHGQINVKPNGTATANYTVTVTHVPSNNHVTVSGTITATNPNSAPVAATLDDHLQGSDSTVCNITGGASQTLGTANNGVNAIPYSCWLPDNADMSNVTNKVTLSWAAQVLSNGANLAAGSTDFTTPTIGFTQSVTDGCVSLTDVGAPAGSLPAQDCASNSTPDVYTYSVDYPAGAPGHCVNHHNEASFQTSDSGTTGSDHADVLVCVGADLNVTKTATPAFQRVYLWSINKTVDNSVIHTAGSATANYNVAVTHDNGTDSGWQVTGKITVSNPNDWEGITLGANGLTDAINNGGSCSLDNANALPATIAAGQSQDFNYTCIYGSAPSPLDGTNTATATWDADAAFTADSSTSGSADANFGTTTPKLVNSEVNVTDNNAPASSGLPTTVDYTMGALNNQGTYTINFPYSIIYNDTAGTCTNHPNTASFVATDDSTVKGSSQANVTVCVGKDLSVKKDATPSFDRLYKWQIAKAVDKTALSVGGTANYTVTVTHDSGTNGNWQVNGTIHVTNPNDWESVSLTGVADNVDNGGSCSITSGNPNGSIAAGATADLGYQCTYTSTPNPSSFTNTATASWASGLAYTPHSSAQGTATGDFSQTSPKIKDGSVSVTDTLGGKLGTASYTQANPITFKYSKTFTSPTAGCVTVPNTATFTTSDTGATGSASQSVRLYCNTGALTIGFWQNKNGQGIISGTGQVALGTWLRQFHPFSDAPSSGLATYVSNIIKAASAGGTSMNPMLRAQTLATALNVYFSDPSLGGVKISAPSGPIGNVTIDLTSICKMIDGSGGTATCSGTYEDASSAFGGAPSMTVMNMLLYQNTSDPAADAGAVWYGQNKTTQGLAKDAFDAINNQVAFGP